MRLAHRESVRAALAELERYTQARIGNIHAPEMTGKFVAATFEHDTARPVDGYAAPQLHTHAVLFNLTERDNGESRTLQPHEMFVSQRCITAVYRSELALHLERLGYELERGKHGQPEIKGYTKEYLDASSPRGEQIKDHLRAQGIDGAAAAQIAAHHTRDRKELLSQEEVLRRHRELASQFGNQADRIVAQARECGQYQVSEPEMAAQQAVTWARDHVFERSAVQDRRAILESALARGMGETKYASIRQEFERRVRAGEFQELDHNGAGQHFTTTGMIRMEREIIAQMQGGNRRSSSDPMLVSPQVRNEIRDRHPELSTAQRSAVEDLLLSREKIVGLDGAAGAGKTTVLSVIREAAQTDGYSVEGFAPTSCAAQKLAEAGMETCTLQTRVGAVMDSYNLVNGVHSTQNKRLNVDILKKDWGFNGILMSDWNATCSAVGAANGGLDLEMYSGKFMNPRNLLPAIKDGQVSEATIDDKVRRIFRTAIRFGFLDRDQTDLSIPYDSQMGRQVALQEALESVTLLKNQNHVLPLDEDSIHTIAVFGPDAWPAVPGAGGSAHVDPFEATSIMTGLSDYLGRRVKVLYSRGLPTTQLIFRSTRYLAPSGKSANQPVKVEFFDNPNFSGSPIRAYASYIATYRSEKWTPPAEQRKSIRYTAEYMPETTGAYTVLAAAGGSDTYTVLIDGRKVLEQPRRERQAPQFADVQMTAGRAVKVEVDYLPDASYLGYLPDSSYPRMGLGIRAASEIVLPEVAKLASMAGAAVVAVGFDPTTEQEGLDRSYALPFGQVNLIQAVAAANRKAIVILMGGGGVATQKWTDDVPAFLHDYYPGEEGGKAIAEILFGQRSPEGRLPFSFAKSWEQNPTRNSYYAPPVPAGQTPLLYYTEGVFLGYRYYTSKHLEPLFPFGFGLSYTTFRFSNLKVSPEMASPDGPVTVSFDVTNTGRREGADVAQLYVGDPSAKVQRPLKELKGYEKVRLKPGETAHVALVLRRRSLVYWDAARHGWKVDPGKFTVYVGDSSENTPLTRNFEVK